jgi:hypothetical protein
LVHRDSYPSVKPPPYSQPGTPAEIVPPVQESTESRLTSLEHTLYDLHSRLARNEETTNYLYSRNHVLTEALTRSLSVSATFPGGFTSGHQLNVLAVEL